MHDGFSYTCAEGETFDSISLNLYGNERYACELLKANPALCRLMRFKGGEALTVPTVYIPDTGNALENLTHAVAPWK